MSVLRKKKILPKRTFPRFSNAGKEGLRKISSKWNIPCNTIHSRCKRRKERTISLWFPKESENVCVRKVVGCLILHNLIEIIIIFKCGFVVLINYKHMVCKTHAARVN